MDIEAVRLPEQDILSAVMRRQIIIHATPYLSLDPKANPLFRCGDAVQGLVRTYRGEVRNLLSGLSHGKISISDFSMKVDDMLGRIKESSGVDISAFSEIEITVFHIRQHIDTVCAMARSFISFPPGNVDNLGCADNELLRQVEAARAVVSSKVAERQMSVAVMVAPAIQAAVEQVLTAVMQASLAAAPGELRATVPEHEKRLLVITDSNGVPLRATVPEHEKRLLVITDSNGIPLKDHPKYGHMAARFLLDAGITDTKCPKMTALYNALADLPLGGQGLSKTVLRKKLGMDERVMGALVFRLKEKKLYLDRKEIPQVPGCFVQVTGRATPQMPEGSVGKKPQHFIGCYCLGLTLAVEE